MLPNQSLLFYCDEPPAAPFVLVGETTMTVDATLLLILSAGGMLKNGNLAIISDAWQRAFADSSKPAHAEKPYGEGLSARIKQRNEAAEKLTNTDEKRVVQLGVLYSAHIDGNRITLSFYW